MTTHSPIGPEDDPVGRRDPDAGLSSSAHWLNWKCGIGFNAAREKVRVARALEYLPQISAAFERGMTRVATPDNEDFLLQVARNGTAAHVENLVRGYRGALRAEERERADALHEKRELYWRTQEDGALLLYARLAPEQSALVIKALDFVMNRLYDPENEQREPEDPTHDAPGYFMGDPTNEPFAALRADALVLMAEYALANPEAPVRPGERHQVVVHVDAEALAHGAGRAELEDGPWLAADTVRRLGCDASVVALVEDEEGNPLHVGRRQRTIPPAIRRALASRDAGCRFPGCTQSRYTEAHHVKHWADGGETKLANLLTTCKRHHRLLHEGRFEVHATSSGGFVFTGTDGRVIEPAPDVTAETPADAEALRAMNRKQGLEIDERTLFNRCDERIDYGLAVDSLMRRDRIGPHGVPGAG